MSCSIMTCIGIPINRLSGIVCLNNSKYSLFDKALAFVSSKYSTSFKLSLRYLNKEKISFLNRKGSPPVIVICALSLGICEPYF